MPLDIRLPDEKINRLLPALSLLAEDIGKRVSINTDSLRKFLVSVGQEEGGGTLTEFELWAKTLEKVRDNPNDNQKNDTIDKLKKRGIPEFPAMLAVYVVTNQQDRAAEPQLSCFSNAYDAAKTNPLIVEPERVNFGCLKYGEEASSNLQVFGEPVIEVVGGSRLNITLLPYGPTKTLVKLRLCSGNAGESFTEEIILRGITSEARVTVTASWEQERLRLSYCPICKISRKSLFWNCVNKKYECLNLKCKATGPELDKLVSPFKRS